MCGGNSKCPDLKDFYFNMCYVNMLYKYVSLIVKS